MKKAFQELQRKHEDLLNRMNTTPNLTQTTTPDPEWQLVASRKLDQAHLSAQAKGLTKQIRIASTIGEPLTTSNMFELLAIDQQDTPIDGAAYSAQGNRGTVTVTARDEQHR